jgi:hypothetical protein
VEKAGKNRGFDYLTTPDPRPKTRNQHICQNFTRKPTTPPPPNLPSRPVASLPHQQTSPTTNHLFLALPPLLPIKSPSRSLWSFRRSARPFDKTAVALVLTPDVPDARTLRPNTANPSISSTSSLAAPREPYQRREKPHRAHNWLSSQSGDRINLREGLSSSSNGFRATLLTLRIGESPSTVPGRITGDLLSLVKAPAAAQPPARRCASRRGSRSCRSPARKSQLT